MSHVRINKTSEQILIQKSNLTGVSKTKLVEYALINMPFVPQKKIKNGFKQKR